MATQSRRANSRGWVWLAWVLLVCSVIACGTGIYGAFMLEAAYSSYGKAKVLSSMGWAIENVDAYFLMAVISIIWIQVCATAADTEANLKILESKLDRLLNPESDTRLEVEEDHKTNSSDVTMPEYSGSPRGVVQSRKIDPHLE